MENTFISHAKEAQYSYYCSLVITFTLLKTVLISVNYLKEKRIVAYFKIQTRSEYNLLKVFQLNTFIGQTKTEAFYGSTKKIKVSFFCLKMKVSWNPPY